MKNFYFLALFIIIVIGLVLYSIQKSDDIKKNENLASIDSSTYPLSVKDVRGLTIHIPVRPKRVISFAPSITEIIYAMSGEKNLIANTEYCNYPEDAKLKAKVGGISNPEIEKLISLKPDLVLSSTLTPLDAVKQIELLKIPIVVFNHSSLNQIFNDIDVISKIIGYSDYGKDLLSDLKNRRKSLNEKFSDNTDIDKIKTLVLFGTNGLFSCGKGSYINEIIDLAGGVNVAQSINSPWPQISFESILNWNPDVIFVTSTESQNISASANVISTWKNDKRWKKIDAVKNDRIKIIGDSMLTVPGPRLIEAAQIMNDFLHSSDMN